MESTDPVTEGSTSPSGEAAFVKNVAGEEAGSVDAAPAEINGTESANGHHKSPDPVDEEPMDTSEPPPAEETESTETAPVKTKAAMKDVSGLVDDPEAEEEPPKDTFDSMVAGEKTEDKAEDEAEENAEKSEENAEDTENAEERTEISENAKEKTEDREGKKEITEETPENEVKSEERIENAEDGEKSEEKVERAEKSGEKLENAEKSEEKVENAEKSEEKVENAEKSEEKVENAEKSEKSEEKVENAEKSEEKVENVEKSEEKVENAEKSEEKVENAEKSEEKVEKKEEKQDPFDTMVSGKESEKEKLKDAFDSMLSGEKVEEKPLKTVDDDSDRDAFDSGDVGAPEEGEKKKEEEVVTVEDDGKPFESEEAWVKEYKSDEDYFASLEPEELEWHKENGPKVETAGNRGWNAPLVTKTWPSSSAATTASPGTSNSASPFAKVASIFTRTDPGGRKTMRASTNIAGGAVKAGKSWFATNVRARFARDVCNETWAVQKCRKSQTRR